MWGRTVPCSEIIPNCSYFRDVEPEESALERLFVRSPACKARHARLCGHRPRCMTQGLTCGTCGTCMRLIGSDRVSWISKTGVFKFQRISHFETTRGHSTAVTSCAWSDEPDNTHRRSLQGWRGRKADPVPASAQQNRGAENCLHRRK